MKITDEAVNAAVEALCDRQIQPPLGRHLVHIARAALEAALPHLEGATPAAHDQLAAEVEPWLRECGSCDAGLPMSCTCPPGDYRSILLKVWRAYEIGEGATLQFDEPTYERVHNFMRGWDQGEVVSASIIDRERQATLTYTDLCSLVDAYKRGGATPAIDSRGVYEAAASLQTAEDIATVIEEYADDLEPPTTVEWLELRDWFKDLLHEVAARAREIGGAS